MKVDEEQIKHDIKCLRIRIGKYATKRLREGKAVLNCWRGTTPYNWWVESENGRSSHLWHSSGLFDHPSLHMFELIKNTGGKIPGSIFHRDGGKPSHSIYLLKKEYRK